MLRHHSNFLRRTAAALAATSGLLVIADAQAQSAVRLTSGSTTAECTYSTMSVQPNGTVAVVCSGTIANNGGTTTPPPDPTAPTTYSLSSSGGTVLAGAATGLTVLRNGNTAGKHVVLYNVDGDACSGWGDYAVTFSDGSSTPMTIPQASLRTSGTRCTITLGPTMLTDGTTVSMKGNPSSATFTIGTQTIPNPTPTVPAGCPTPPSNMQTETWLLNGLHNYWMAPQNVVVSVPMPTTGVASYPAFAWTPSPRTYTPSSGTVRYSVSKCPGQIIENDPTNWCNGAGGITYGSQSYVAVAGGLYRDKATANLYGMCWAPISEGPWYFNFRYENFNNGSGCPYGVSTCGVLWQLQ